MEAALNYIDQFLFAVLPYAALVSFFVLTIQRYLAQKYTYSSLSSQFLENKQHFTAMVPFHYGILFVLLGHVFAFLLPDVVLAWNREPMRLYALEISALIAALLAMIGLLTVIIRRLAFVKVRTITTPADWILYVLLAVQFGSGIYVAVMHNWGSSWFAASAAPYLWSIVKLNPDISYVAALPLLVKVHIINASLVIGFFPFTRLVHILVIPNPYLWRRPQVVRWNWKPDPLRGSKK